MLESLLGSQSIFGIQRQAAFQEVPKERQPPGILCKSLMLAEEVEYVALGSDGDLHLFDCVGLGIWIVELVDEAELLVEVTVNMQALFEHFDTKTAPCLHHQLQHMIV